MPERAPDAKPRSLGDLRALWRNQFVRFLIVGGVNTLFGFAVYTFLILCHAHYAVAALLGTACGVLFNFKTTGLFVFRNSSNRLLFKFCGVYAVTYGLNVLGLKLLASPHVLSQDARRNLVLAGAVLLLPMAAISFTLNKLFVFAKRD